MLIYNSVFVVYQSSESGDVVEIVSKSKLNALVASKNSRRCCLPIPDLHTARKIVSAKVRLKFILNRNLVRQAYRLTSVQAVSCFKQTNDAPVRSRFYTQCKPGLKILSGGILRSFRRDPNFARRRAV